MAGPHQPERAATTDLPNQINNVCMYVCTVIIKQLFLFLFFCREEDSFEIVSSEFLLMQKALT